LQSLVYPTSYVVKQNVPAGANLVGQNAQSRNIGTGPWMFGKAWRYRQEIYLTRNPHWYNASRLKISEIDIPMISNVDLAYREYLSGQVPVAALPSAFLPSARSFGDFHIAPLLTVDYIAPNTGKDSLCKPVSCAPFNNVHFRRAMMYAIDRATITQKILHGSQAPLCGLIPKGIAGYDPSLCSLTPYDPSRAKAELALAMKDFHGKLPNEGRLTLVYQALSQDYSNEYTEVQSELAAVGINIHIQAMPLNNWITLTGANYTPLMEDQWSDDYPDAQDYAENLLGAGSPYNVGNYDNAAFQKLITQADVTPNGVNRANLYVQAQRTALQDAAFIMIGQLQGAYRWKSNLHGFYISSSYTFQPANQDWTNASVS
jgi:ABC-type transport system substrate-binding protein